MCSKSLWFRVRRGATVRVMDPGALGIGGIGVGSARDDAGFGRGTVKAGSPAQGIETERVASTAARKCDPGFADENNLEGVIVVGA